jgi:hypothetical protein
MAAVPKSGHKRTDQYMFSHARALASMADVQHDNEVPTMVFCPNPWRCDRYLAVIKPIFSPLSIRPQMEESFTFFWYGRGVAGADHGEPKRVWDLVKQILSTPWWERPVAHTRGIIKSCVHFVTQQHPCQQCFRIIIETEVSASGVAV